MFPRDMVCLRNICVDTLHRGDIDDIIIIIIIMYWRMTISSCTGTAAYLRTKQ
jgi:hypothetical protein